MIRRLRFSIAGLMVVVLVAAIGLAAWRDPTETWNGVVFLLTCGVLTLAVVGVLCRGGAKQIWWLGFALFGWGYFALVFSYPHELLPRLPTSALLGVAVPNFREPSMQQMGGGLRSIGFRHLGYGGFGGASIRRPFPLVDRSMSLDSPGRRAGRDAGPVPLRGSDGRARATGGRTETRGPSGSDVVAPAWRQRAGGAHSGRVACPGWSPDGARAWGLG